MAADRARGAAAVLQPLFWLLAALLVIWPALREGVAWLPPADLASRAWPGTAWLVATSGDPSRGVLGWRVALTLGAVVLAWLAAACTRTLGGDRFAALAAGSLLIVTAAASSIVWDPAGALVVVAAIGVLLLVQALLAPAPAWTRALIGGVLGVVASAGALLPLVVALTFATRTVANASSLRRRAIGPLLALLLVAVAIARLASWGIALPSNVPVPADRVAAVTIEGIADGLSELLRGGLGLWSRSPVVVAFRPHASSGWFVVLLLLVLPAALATLLPLPRARLAALGGLGVLATTTVLCTSGPLPVFATAWAVPGLALVIAALAAWNARATLALAGVLWLAGVTGVAGPRSLDAALAASPHPMLAARLAELTGSDAPLEAVVLAASGGTRAIAPAVEWSVGSELLRRHQRHGGSAAALDWVTRWRAARADDAVPLPQLAARELELLLRERGPEAAAERLVAELAENGADPTWRAAIAGMLVDALHKNAREPRFVAALLPPVERMLAGAASRPELASAEELQCLALLRVGQEKLVEAITLAERAVAKAPASASPHLVLARIFLGRGELAAGLREVAVARQLDPADPAALLLEGRLYCSNADLAERGVKSMLQALALDPTLSNVNDDIEAGTVSAADALVARGQHELARDLIGRAIDAIGRRTPLLRSYAKVALQQRALGAAVKLLEEIHAAQPDDLEVRGELAAACRDAGYAQLLRHDRDAAAECFERALEVAPPDFDGAGMRAVLAQRKAEQDAARDPTVETARAAFDEAVQKQRAGDLDGAVAALRRSLEALPLNPLAHLWLGRIELDRERAKEAEGALRTAIAVGAVQQIDVEEAWPLLLRALLRQSVEAKKINAAVDEYLRTYPAGKFRAEIEALRA